MKPRLSQRGASLAELLASMLFLSIVSAMSYSFARAAIMSARTQDAKSDVQEVAFATLDMLARDVRQAGFSAAALPLSGLRAAARQRLEVACDLNGNNTVADANELIAYSYDAQGRRLMRATGGTSPQPVAQNIAALSFGFFDDSGAELVPPAEGLAGESRERVRRIDAHLSVEVPHPEPSATHPLAVTASASIQLRNHR
jgi:hypothetical protein